MTPVRNWMRCYPIKQVSHNMLVNIPLITKLLTKMNGMSSVYIINKIGTRH
jgi:hypothetical protein